MGDFPFKDPDAARFEKPTLFIRGTESPYVPDDVLPLIGRFFPRFALRDIPSGHWVISEKPEEFRQGNRIVLACWNSPFADQHGPPAVLEFLGSSEP